MIKRRFEDKMGSFEWTNLVYCGEGEYFGRCKEVATGMVGANGVLVVKDLVYVDNSGGGYISVFKINPDHSVTETEKIKLGSACDNLSYDPVADALLVATFPDIAGTLNHLHNAETVKKSPLAIDKIKRLPDPAPGKTKHEVGIVLFAKDLMGAISIGLSDSEVNKSILGGIIQEGILVCKDRSLASEVRRAELARRGSKDLTGFVASSTFLGHRRSRLKTWTGPLFVALRKRTRCFVLFGRFWNQNVFAANRGTRSN
jgi:hypothetical protein